jgi:hypothetical protein
MPRYTVIRVAGLLCALRRAMPCARGRRLVTNPIAVAYLSLTALAISGGRSPLDVLLDQTGKIVARGEAIADEENCYLIAGRHLPLVYSLHLLLGISICARGSAGIHTARPQRFDAPDEVREMTHLWLTAPPRSRRCSAQNRRQH